MKFFKEPLFNRLVSPLLITLSVLIETTVFADEIPEGCKDTFETHAYEEGRTSGENLLDMTWNLINDCYRFEIFERIVTDNVRRLTVPEGSSEIVVCRYAGFINGIMENIDDYYKKCELLCYADGKLIGEIAGMFFCQGGLLGFGDPTVPVDFISMQGQMCGAQFEFACNSVLTTTIQQNCPEDLSSDFNEDLLNCIHQNVCAYNDEEDSIHYPYDSSF